MAAEQNTISKQFLEDTEEFHGKLLKQNDTLAELHRKIVPLSSYSSATNPSKEDIEHFKYARSLASFTHFALDCSYYPSRWGVDGINDYFSNSFRLYRESADLRDYGENSNHRHINFAALNLEGLFQLANNNTIFDVYNFIHFLTKRLDKIENYGNVDRVEKFTLDQSDVVDMTELGRNIQKLENRLLNINKIIEKIKPILEKKSRNDWDLKNTIEDYEKQLTAIKEHVEVIKEFITPYIKVAEAIGEKVTSEDPNESHYQMKADLKFEDISSELQGKPKKKTAKEGNVANTKLTPAVVVPSVSPTSSASTISAALITPVENNSSNNNSKPKPEEVSQLLDEIKQAQEMKLEIEGIKSTDSLLTILPYYQSFTLEIPNILVNENNIKQTEKTFYYSRCILSFLGIVGLSKNEMRDYTSNSYGSMVLKEKNTDVFSDKTPSELLGDFRNQSISSFYNYIYFLNKQWDVLQHQRVTLSIFYPLRNEDPIHFPTFCGIINELETKIKQSENSDKEEIIKIREHYNVIKLFILPYIKALKVTNYNIEEIEGNVSLNDGLERVSQQLKTMLPKPSQVPSASTEIRTSSAPTSTFSQQQIAQESTQVTGGPIIHTSPPAPTPTSGQQQTPQGTKKGNNGISDNQFDDEKPVINTNEIFSIFISNKITEILEKIPQTNENKELRKNIVSLKGNLLGLENIISSKINQKDQSGIKKNAKDIVLALNKVVSTKSEENVKELYEAVNRLENKTNRLYGENSFAAHKARKITYTIGIIVGLCLGFIPGLIVGAVYAWNNRSPEQKLVNTVKTADSIIKQGMFNNGTNKVASIPTKYIKNIHRYITYQTKEPMTNYLRAGISIQKIINAEGQEHYKISLQSFILFSENKAENQKQINSLVDVVRQLYEKEIKEEPNNCYIFNSLEDAKSFVKVLDRAANVNVHITSAKDADAQDESQVSLQQQLN